MGEHIDIVLHGKAGTAMQAFAKQLTATEIAAVVTYERNAWGNNSGDSVQAADVNGGGADSGASSSDAEVPVTLPATLPEAATQVEAVVTETAEVVLDDLTMDELMTLGEQVYMTSCVACHQPTGMGLPGAFPSLVQSPIIMRPLAITLKW